MRPEAARLAPTTTITKPGFHPWDDTNEAVLLNGRLLATTYHGSYYRIEVQVDLLNQAHVEPTPAVSSLVFELPSYQRGGQAEMLLPIQLPSAGEAIQLLIYTGLAALLPYPVYMP